MAGSGTGGHRGAFGGFPWGWPSGGCHRPAARLHREDADWRPPDHTGGCLGAPGVGDGHVVVSEPEVCVALPCVMPGSDSETAISLIIRTRWPRSLWKGDSVHSSAVAGPNLSRFRGMMCGPDAAAREATADGIAPSSLLHQHLPCPTEARCGSGLLAWGEDSSLHPQGAPAHQRACTCQVTVATVFLSVIARQHHDVPEQRYPVPDAS